MYVIQYFGDLVRDGKYPMEAHATFDRALQALTPPFGESSENGWITPDPEDDRIIIWRFEPGMIGKVVWHFSGWHWQHGAADLPGGPLPQGKLPGFDKSLYDLAMEDM